MESCCSWRALRFSPERGGRGEAYNPGLSDSTFQVPSVSSTPSALTPAGDPLRTPVSEREVADLLVAALNLEVAPADIDAEAPLYGDGLGLDSIDILELALEISKKYGFELRSDDDNNVRIFGSLRSLTAHVNAHRTR